MNMHIPVARPTLGTVEKELVIKCLETGWISSAGRYVEEFELLFADKIGAKHAISVCNGTCALHLALLGIGLLPEDEVIVPAVTYIATANAVRYCGAKVVLADVDPVTLNLTPDSVSAVMTEKTRAILPVHLFGVPCDMAGLKALADSNGVVLIEDAAEAIGSKHKGQFVGTIGTAGMFSFFGNKTITTGEGGMLVTNDDALNKSYRLFRGQGMSTERRYWHPIVGYNYRMTNICAAIGIGQLEKLDQKVETRRGIRDSYKREFDRFGLTDLLTMPDDAPDAFNSVWMVNVVLDDTVAVARDVVMQAMGGMGVETRPTFYPLYEMPPYSDLAGHFPGSTRALRGITLPTFEGLTDDEISHIAQSLAQAIRA